MKTLRVLIVVLFIALMAVGACTPKPSGPVKVRIGTQPWIGYGPWWIAQEKGLFAKYGLEAELVDFVQDTEVNAAFTSGEMDAANLATHTAIKLFANGVDLKVVLLEDASYEADAILAITGVQSIADLKGKGVAYEEGSTSDLLLNYALAQNGLSLADITPVPMPASDAGAALIAGRVEVAVTYEPYISAALAEGKDVHVLYTAGERPGLISDVFVVSGKFARENLEVVKTLLKVWNEAMAFYNSNPDEGKRIIANAVGSSLEELATAFDGVQFYDLAANQSELSGAFMETIQDVAEVSKSIGLFETIPDLKAMVDASFLK